MKFDYAINCLRGFIFILNLEKGTNIFIQRIDGQIDELELAIKTLEGEK